MITVHGLDDASYKKLRYAIVLQFESSGRTNLRPYINTEDTRVTIGAGFNIESVATNRNAVFDAMGIGADEITVRQSLNNIIQSATDDATLLSQLDAVMANRATTHPGGRTTFAFLSATEIRDVFDVIAPGYESLVNSWLAGIGDSRERDVLFDLVYNRPALLGANLRAAVDSGNRAEAFFEIRYKSNATGENGVAKRRYVESHIFGLFDQLNPANKDQVNQVESFNALQMYTRHEALITIYDASAESKKGFENANPEMTAIEGRSMDLGTVTATTDMLKAAMARLVYDFAGFDRILDLSNAVKGAESVLAGFNPTKVWVAGLTSAGVISTGVSEVAALTVDRTGKNDSDLIFGARNIDGSDANTSDTLRGGGGDDLIVGGGGADVIDGGDGEDTVTYQFSGAGVTVVVPDSTHRANHLGGAGNGGDAQGDTLIDIENIIGSAFADSITGNGDANLLYGGAGIDTLSGGLGDDMLVGGAGNDMLNGGEGKNDIAIFSGSCPDYDITYNQATNTWTVAHMRGGAADGVDTLSGVEFVQFGDIVSRLEVGRSICPTGGQDLVFVIDTTGSMGDDIDAVKAAATRLISQIFDDPISGAQSRIGIAGFKDPGETQTILSFTDQASVDARRGAALSAINSITVGGGGDWPEGVYSGLLHALSGALGEWRTDANIRRIVLFGDAPPKDNELRAQVQQLAADILSGGSSAMTSVSVTTTGALTLINVTADINGVVVNRSVEIYTVVIGNDADADVAFRDISDTNHGLTLYADNADQVVQALSDAMAAPYLVAIMGTNGNDALSGTPAADRMIGGIGNDFIVGGRGNDLIRGDAGNDALYGDLGDDLLDGGIGADVMVGDTGDDHYIIDNAGDQVVEYDGEGRDTVETPFSFIMTGASIEVVRLTGTAAAYVIGSGADDRITGNNANNMLIGQGGNDWLDGGLGLDTMIGGDGDDRYFVNTEFEQVIEEAGPASGIDTVESSAYNYSLAYNVENLTLIGAAYSGFGNVLANTIIGNSQNNFIYGNRGADRMIGGAGDDLYDVDDAGDVVIELSGEGIDKVNSDISFSLAGQSLENLELFGSANIAGTGNELDNVIFGNSGANALSGGGGNDTLDGRAGADTMIGGTGDDRYYVDNAGDTVTEANNEGLDWVVSTVSFSLSGQFLERLDLWGTANINGTGNGLSNIIGGNIGNNILDGLGGADTMAGGPGDDIFVVDNAGDQVLELSFEGVDTVRSSVSFSLNGQYLENLSLLGSANINGTGNTYHNVITGNAGNNVLTGLAGSDTIDGGLGADAMIGGVDDDVYYVDNAGDTTVENSNEGYDSVFSTVSFNLSGQFVERLVLQGIAAINATGNGLANVLVGNAGNNILDGLGGVDSMSGGLGNDTYVIDNAGDTVFEANGEGTDTVRSSLSFNLSGQFLENLVLTGSANLNATGNGLVNSLTGNSGSNILDGLVGADSMAGGLGDDIYIVDNAGDTAVEANGEGTDTVRASVSFNLSGQFLENLVLTGSANLNATGNGLANILTGNSGSNILDGLGGADVMSGGLGNDTYVVDHAGDTVLEANGEGTDTVRASVSFNLSGQFLETLVLTGSAGLSGTGNGLNNIITGNTGANALNGGGGDDVLSGGLGVDTLTGGAGLDRFRFADALGGGNVDTIADYAVGQDKIELDDAIFTALGLGTLTAAAFYTGAAAHDADDRVIYNAATGALYYDADGNGAGAAVQFAQLNPGLGIGNGDFLVI